MMDAGTVWVLIPLAAIVMWGVRGMAQALAASRTRGVTPALPDEGLRAEVEQLKDRVAELEERQDFTERALTADRGSRRLDA